MSYLGEIDSEAQNNFVTKFVADLNRMYVSSQIYDQLSKKCLITV